MSDPLESPSSSSSSARSSMSSPGLSRAFFTSQDHRYKPYRIRSPGLSSASTSSASCSPPASIIKPQLKRPDTALPAATSTSEENLKQIYERLMNSKTYGPIYNDLHRPATNWTDPEFQRLTKKVNFCSKFLMLKIVSSVIFVPFVPNLYNLGTKVNIEVAFEALSCQLSYCQSPTSLVISHRYFLDVCQYHCRGSNPCRAVKEPEKNYL